VIISGSVLESTKAIILLRGAAAALPSKFFITFHIKLPTLNSGSSKSPDMATSKSITSSLSVNRATPKRTGKLVASSLCTSSPKVKSCITT